MPASIFMIYYFIENVTTVDQGQTTKLMVPKLNIYLSKNKL